jgi:hypothetical protein
MNDQTKRREKYEWARLRVDHSFFVPGRTSRAFGGTVREAAKRYGFVLVCRDVGIYGQRGVLVWRIA